MIDCTGCGNELTAMEVVHYGHVCEECEVDWNNRVEAWRHGAEDAELEKMFASESTHTEH